MTRIDRRVEIAKNISFTRSELMGAAIVYIMLYHSRIGFGGSDVGNIFSFFKNIGYIGVDIFFFLSGVGLINGWMKKNYTIAEFYWRRFTRILPFYWAILILDFLISIPIKGTSKLIPILSQMAFINFLFQGDLTHWFIAGILLCYIVFPFIVTYYLRAGKKIYFTAGITLLFLIISLYLSFTGVSYLIIFTIRLPLFLMGIHIGYFVQCNNANECYDKGRVIYSNKTMSLIMIMSITLLYLVWKLIPVKMNWQYGLWWYPTIIMTLPFCVLVSNLIVLSQDSIVIKYLRNFLKLCGRYSLEIYLVHTIFFSYGHYALNHLIAKPNELIRSLMTGNFLEYIVFIIASLFFAIIFKKTVCLTIGFRRKLPINL